MMSLSIKMMSFSDIPGMTVWCLTSPGLLVQYKSSMFFSLVGSRCI